MTIFPSIPSSSLYRFYFVSHLLLIAILLVSSLPRDLYSLCAVCLCPLSWTFPLLAVIADRHRISTFGAIARITSSLASSLSLCLSNHLDSVALSRKTVTRHLHRLSAYLGVLHYPGRISR